MGSFMAVSPGMLSSGDQMWGKRVKPMKIFHKLHQLFPDFDFGDADKVDDICLDASQVANDSTQSSY